MAATVAVVGAGIVGESWATAFLRGGCRVRLHDRDPHVAKAVARRVLEELHTLHAAGLHTATVDDPASVRLMVADTIEQAVAGVDHVQECAPERLDVKQSLFAVLDRAAPAGATIASSSSALLPSSFIEGLRGAARCMIAHPLNPPHLVPAVEIVPAPSTADESVARVVALLERVGQRPFRLTGEVEGFVMNRLQGALLTEAFRLIDAGLVDVDGIDTALVHGLGLRWSCIGPIETLDLNAPNGVVDFFARYGGAYRDIAESSKAGFDWNDAFGERLQADRRERVPADRLDERRAWRDQELLALAAFRRTRGHDDDSDETSCGSDR